MNWPAALRTKTRRVFALFALAELTLVTAVLFLTVAGVHSVLDSRSGIFVSQVGPSEPGWRAHVEPSSVTVIVEQYQGETVGVAFATHKQGVDGGYIALFSSRMKVGDSTFAELDPEAIADELSTTLRLRIDDVLVVDEATWPEVLGRETYEITNPDFVSADQSDGFEVGSVTLDGENTGRFIGLKDPNADPAVLLVRQALVWTALVDRPPENGHRLAAKLGQLSGGPVDVFPFPAGDSDPAFDDGNVEELLRRAVPFPAGAVPDHRVRVRIFDRTGSADLILIAAQLGAEGYEVVEMGNADVFDDGPSELFVPSTWIGPDSGELEEYVELPVQIEEANEPESVATIVIGNDFALLSA